MRVLHVISTGQRRGAEIFASDLVGALGREGLSQRVVVLRGAEGVCVPFEAPVEVWESNGWTLPPLRTDAKTLWRLRRLTGGWRPDLIQAHGGEALKYSVVANAGCSPRIVYRRIGSAPPWVATGARRAAHGTLMRRATKVIALAEVTRRETIRMFRVPPQRVTTIPRGVDPRRLQPQRGGAKTRRTLSIPAEAKVLLSLGALTREKDPLAHLEVAERVFWRRSDVFHLMAGDGPLRPQVEAAVRERGLEERVQVLGNREDVADLLAASDVMLLASATEGMPGCLIEAGMSGMAVSAYAVAAVPEVVEDRVTGLLAPPGDLDRLTACTLELLADDRARSALGESARRRCLDRFDTHTVVRRYLELYEQIVENDRSA